MLFKARDFIFDDKKTNIMGILNITPDSFSDGGAYKTCTDAVNMANTMVRDGADIIDIGGQSTRPGSTVISKEQEWERIEPVLTELCKNKNFAISVDTFYPAVAKKALLLGADIINDVSGRLNPEMVELAKEYGCGLIIMHSSNIKSDDATAEINSFFRNAYKEALVSGLCPEQLCFDAGIGFNKTSDECYGIIKNTDKVRLENSFYLLGASRKRLIGELFNDIAPDKRDFGTIAAHTVGIMGGANIIRVHAVLAAVQAAKVADAIKKKV